MIKRRVVLHFPKNLVNKPIVYRLVKDFDIEFNILKAEVNPKEEGLLVVELQGKEDNLKRSMDFLKEEGLKVQSLSKDVAMDRSRCVDCTVCVPLCPTQALIKDPVSFEVEFIKEKCIACGICIHACPYKAMSIKF